MPRSLSLALALLLAAPLPALAGPTSSAAPAATKTGAMKTARSAKAVTLPDGLQYTDVVVGKGARLRAGQTAIVHYVGTFPDGKKFDSSRDRREPYSFTVGGHVVISCWDEGVVSMRTGGRRKLVCPPALAYGERGAGGVIPPNATLNFDVELLAIR